MNKAFTVLIVSILCIIFTDLRAQAVNPNANPNGSAGAGTAAGGTAGSAAALPTTQQLGQMIEQKDYANVIKETQRIMRMKSAAATYDKADLEVLRGEAQIGLKQQGPAAGSFTEAGKDATDPTKAGYAKGMVKLLQQSKAFMYTPKANANDPTRQTTPISIIDPSSRKQALAALFADEWTPAQAQIAQLKKQNNGLGPILQAAQLVGEMRGLELAGTDKDTQTSKALGDLNESAATLMNDYLERSDKQVDQIETLANAASGDGKYETQRRGLTGVQTSQLKDVIATTAKLSLAAKQVAAASDKGQAFNKIAEASDTLNKRAFTVLNTDYSETIDPNSNRPVQTGNQSTQTGNQPVQRNPQPYHH